MIFGRVVIVISLMVLAVSLALNKVSALKITGALCIVFSIFAPLALFNPFSVGDSLLAGKAPPDVASSLALFIPLEILLIFSAYFLDYQPADKEKPMLAKKIVFPVQGKWPLMFSRAKLLLVLIYIFWVGFTPLHGMSANFFKGVFILSAILVLASALIGVVKWLYVRNNGQPFFSVHLLHCGILLLALLIALIRIISIENQAVAYLTGKADEIKLLCDSQKVCPSEIPGWKDGRYYEFQSKDGSHFLMRYQPDKTKFNIWINYGLDAGYFLHGGIGMPVEKGLLDISFEENRTQTPSAACKR